MNVLYIMGDQRSGTTLVENLIAQMDGVLTVGELRLLHGHYHKQGPGDLWDWQCSCGQAIERCSFWTKILHHQGADLLNDTVITKANNSGPTETIVSIYRKIQELEHPKLIVDSSKNPFAGFRLRRRLRGNMKIIIVRKSFFEVAASKYFHLKKAGSSFSPFKLLIATFLVQAKLNVLVWTRRAEGIRYEDLLDESKRTKWLTSIARDFGLPVNPLPDKMVNASQYHSIAGTPSRFKDSEIKSVKKGKQFLKEILPFLQSHEPR